MSGYCTPAELRTAINKTGTTGSASDDNLNLIISAVSQSLDRFFHRKDGFLASQIASVRMYPGTGLPYQYIDECVEVTAVAVKESADATTYTAWASTDWITFSGDPDRPNFNDLPYTALMVDPTGDQSDFTNSRYSFRPGFRPVEGVGRLTPTVQVTARWGYSDEIPPLIRQATIALAGRWFKQGESAYTDTLASAELGGLIYRAANADIKQMLEGSRYFKPTLG